MIRRLAAIILFACTLPAADHGIRVEAVSPWSDNHGYTPVVVSVSAPRDATLDVSVQAFGPTAQGIIRVSDGRQARHTILVPPANRDWFSLHQLEWNERDGAARGTASISGRGHNPARAYVVDPDQKADLPRLRRLVEQAGSGSRGDQVEYVAPDELPDRWQGYPDWLVLVLTPRGDAALDQGQRTAIAAWARAGGTLVVSSAELARAWEAQGARVVLDPLTDDAKPLLAAVSANANHENWAPEPTPVPGTETVPVKTFVFLALAFAVVVGPLNLWWVRKRNARHLFLVTTPAVSLLTCVALIVASLLADGVSVKRSAVQVCYLDHRTQQAVRWTGCTYFAAFSRSALELDPQTKVRLLDPELFQSSGYSYRRRSAANGPTLHLDWRQGQLLSGPVVPARLNRQLSFTEHLPERRRLVVERDGDGYRVANGLGAAVLGLRWRDAQGRAWACEDIAAGESAVLALAGEPGKGLSATAPLAPDIGNRIGRDVSLAFDRLRDLPLTFTATLATPMDALPGPAGIDPTPPVVVAFGHLPLGNAGVEAAP